MGTPWRALLLIALSGLGLSVFLTVISLRSLDLSFCEVGTYFSCDTVLGSEYSRILGVPVAWVGTLGYGALFAISYAGLLRGEAYPGFLRLLALLSVLGVAFGLYLTYVEVALIGAVCLLCLASFLAIIPLAVLSLASLRTP